MPKDSFFGRFIPSCLDQAQQIDSFDWLLDHFSLPINIPATLFLRPWEQLLVKFPACTL
jgi:hypothetical protein